MAARAPLSRKSLRTRHKLLVGGLLVLWVFFGVAFYFRLAPTQPDYPIPPGVVAAGCTVALLLAWFGARPRIPRRRPTMPLDDYWHDVNVSATLSRFTYLLELCATFGAIWTFLSGSFVTAAVSFVSIAVLALNGPERFERPADGPEP